MSDRAPSVFLVDDDPAVRDALSLLLEAEGYAVETYASAAVFLAACKPESFGCVVMDLRMPGMDGIQLQEEMARRGFLLPIIFLSGHGDIPTSVRAIKAGAVDFLTKPVAGTELLQRIAVALNAAKQRQAEASQSASAVSLLAGLTERERQVMQLIVAGLSNKKIAIQLGISHRTVEIHKAHVMRKTGAVNALVLARIARDGGAGE